ncbi:uncharacterized protein LOC114240795 [Bombyx mandarina]|uniref:Uncharacterized protein LOC114240795 n=1 Tax=Bombyx mandarina TaxID=7092 RepID=A0A6J2JE04_BOMMA|nr:uncharacterized protein LOC114240795 [Bombyx mandarina]
MTKTQSSTKNTYRFLRLSVCCLIISLAQTKVAPKNISHENIEGINIERYSSKMTAESDARVINQVLRTNPKRFKRQLLSRILQLPLQSRLGSRLPRLPPRQPIILPLVTSAVSDTIRTYPYYFQEIPMAISETVLETVREAAPHVTGALKDISPGIMEIMNMIPNSEKMGPLQKMMTKFPTVLHETVRVATDSIEDGEAKMLEEVKSLEIGPIWRIIKSKPTKSEEVVGNIKKKINWKLEETKQRAQNLYQNIFEDYEDQYPRKKSSRSQTTYTPKKMMKKSSNTIAPVIKESLSEMAQIPHKIKKFVQEMKQ